MKRFFKKKDKKKDEKKEEAPSTPDVVPEEEPPVVDDEPVVEEQAQPKEDDAKPKKKAPAKTNKKKDSKTNKSGTLRGAATADKKEPPQDPELVVVPPDDPPMDADFVQATTPDPNDHSTDRENLPPHASEFPRYVLRQYRSSTGTFEFRTRGKEKHKQGKLITKGIREFKDNPEKYIAMTYQVSMKTWPTKEQEYFLIERQGTSQLAPTGIDDKGWMAVLIHDYQHLPPFPDNEFPMEFRDAYTDHMTYEGKMLHSATHKPICPGRGMGCADSPLLKIIGNIDPSDIKQGQVGDCWLLSAISALAEFDGAIKKLFRKTPNIHEMPRPGPNVYTITLWDLPTWTEVDIVIDERLAANPDSSYSTSTLLGAKPSEDGELWVCYLEKAIAIHCGGFDAITGGQCVHAWSIMTGCREQYIIMMNPKTRKYACWARYNPRTKQWLPVVNDVHKCDNETGVWPIPYPSVGDNTDTGDAKNEMTADEVFKKMYACDKMNYIVGASSKAGGTDEGLVDNHAYTVIEAVQDAAGTGIDMFKVRNPWGKGEIENGEFDDDGPGWEKYPQIKALLNPVVADDGIFWVTKQEFFSFFSTIYISASNMTRFLED